MTEVSGKELQPEDLELRLHLDIPWPEEELSVEVGLFNAVHVGDMDLSLGPTAHTHQSPVLQHLTANGASTHQEVVQVPQLLLEVGAKHCNLAVIPTVALKQDGKTCP